MNHQKIALVTGGNRGIGLEICKQLIQKGYAVVMGSRDLKKGEEALQTFNDILSAGEKPKVCQLDMTDTSSISQAAQWMEKEYGRLDLLINNAGILPNADSSAHVQIEAIDQTFQTNVYGPLRLVQAMLPLLKRSDAARVVNVSSGMGAFSEMDGGYTAYRLSKTALNGLTKMMSIDFKQNNIKVLAACPGWCRTGMGSENAPRNAHQGASSIVWAATEEGAENGCFYRDGKLLAW
jgi:NAD(P)-dependent dehydrogenase (short-subunit alcohol dehydrogenase family)